MLRSLPLERLYRDSRCGSLMLPWTAELVLDRIGREALYEQGETDEQGPSTQGPDGSPPFNKGGLGGIFLTLYDILDQWAQTQPGKTALHFHGEDISYAE